MSAATIITCASGDTNLIRGERFSENGGLAREYAESEFTYNYSVNPIVQQVNSLRCIFPFLGLSNQGLLMKIATNGVLSPGMEGFFAFPHWSMIAPNYWQALKIVILLLETTHGINLTNHLRHSIEYALQENEEKRRFTNDVLQKQRADILIVQAQLGLKYRGKSPRLAKALMNKEGEVGIGLYETLMILLNHFNRFHHPEDLSLDTIGDEYALDGKGKFDAIPCLGRRKEKSIELVCGWLGRTGPRYGAGSMKVIE